MMSVMQRGIYPKCRKIANVRAVKSLQFRVRLSTELAGVRMTDFG
jgi:hypothetical protein